MFSTLLPFPLKYEINKKFHIFFNSDRFGYIGSNSSRSFIYSNLKSGTKSVYISIFSGTMREIVKVVLKPLNYYSIILKVCTTYLL